MRSEPIKMASKRVNLFVDVVAFAVNVLVARWFIVPLVNTLFNNSPIDLGQFVIMLAMTLPSILIIKEIIMKLLSLFMRILTRENGLERNER
jgi:hypothetical protein